MYQLKNDLLTLEFTTMGAELISVVKNGIDYLWDGNSEFWTGRSPVLFPIVGALAEGKYFYKEKCYELPQHGFARRLNFEMFMQNDHEIWFRLKSNAKTKANYPFDFELRIGYLLKKDKVVVKWEVENNGNEVMPFSIGAHPAFMAGPELDDYSLQFKKNTGVETLIFNPNGNFIDIEKGKEEIIENLPFLPLSKDLFEEYPTIILENETEIMLRSYTHDCEVEVSFEGFPYVGIWSPINSQNEVAPFVCIEPWFGIADTSVVPQDIMNKTGIIHLESKEIFSTKYEMTFR